MDRTLDVPARTEEHTFLFTDMEGSTAAWDRDESAMHAAQIRHDSILRTAIADAGGRVFSTAGDGLAAAFAEADAALAAAVTAQRRFVVEPWPTATPLRVRMGLHTGHAIERDGDYFGPAVIRAARLMSLVDGGRIVCSEATHAALRGTPSGVTFIPIGEARLKGLSSPEAVLAVRAPGLPETGAPLEDHSPYRWDAPGYGTRLIGRESEIEQAARHLRGALLVTLTGVGGVGKTRLAVAIAEAVTDAFPDGRAWVDLAVLDEGGDVERALADVLHVRDQPGVDLLAGTCQALGGLRVLLVLDNCEHLLQSVSALVSTLNGSCRHVAVLATSRERLHLDGEVVVNVPPLPARDVHSPAVRLMLDRIGAGDRRVPDAADEEALARIARRLDGLPLALELAAARCRTLGVTEVAERLDQQLGLLADRTRRVARHQTMDAAIDWSYRLLPEAEQRVFDRLAVFAGAFNLDAAEEVGGGGVAAVDEALASLVDKSLVEHDGPWFRLLEPTRQFVAKRLLASGDLEEAEAAHTAVITSQLVTVRDGLHGREEAAWVRTLDLLWPDVRTVVRRSLDQDDAEAVITLVTHLAFEAFWRRPEAFVWIDEAVARYRNRQGPRRADLLGAGGLVAWLLLDVPRGIELAEEALTSSPGPATTLDCLAESAAIGAYNFAGRYEDAIGVAQRAIDALALGGDRWNESVMRSNLAISAAVRGTVSDEALHAVDTGAALGRGIGNHTAMAYAVFTQSLLMALSDQSNAPLLADTAKAWATAVRNQWLMAQTATTMATSAAASGRPAEALSVMVESAEELLRTGWGAHAWAALWGMIEPLHLTSRSDAAALALGACEASGVTRYGFQRIPPDLDALTGPAGDDRLRALRSMGPLLPLAELIRIAANQAPVPQVTAVLRNR